MGVLGDGSRRHACKKGVKIFRGVPSARATRVGSNRRSPSHSWLETPTCLSAAMTLAAVVCPRGVRGRFQYTAEAWVSRATATSTSGVVPLRTRRSVPRCRRVSFRWLSDRPSHHRVELLAFHIGSLASSAIHNGMTAPLAEAVDSAGWSLIRRSLWSQTIEVFKAMAKYC